MRFFVRTCRCDIVIFCTVAPYSSLAAAKLC